MDPSGIKAFRIQYAKGENFVVAHDVDRTYEKSYGNLQVKFVNLKELILRMSKIWTS